MYEVNEAVDVQYFTMTRHGHSYKVMNIYTNVHSENRFVMLKVGGMNGFLPTLQLLYKGDLAKSNYQKHMNLRVLRCG
jgi:hypothetical protein